MSSRAGLEITVHIGQTVRVFAIFVFALNVQTSDCFHCRCRLFYLSVFGTETISSDDGSIDIGHILVIFICQENVEISI